MSPFRSEAQRKWMHSNKPDMAKRWEKETPEGRKLPEHVEREEPRKKPKKRGGRR